jgi:hypothetical protein
LAPFAGKEGTPMVEAPPSVTSNPVGRKSMKDLLRVWGERLGVVLIVLGTAGLIQPFVQDFFTYGFSVLLAGTIIFIIASHL